MFGFLKTHVPTIFQTTTLVRHSGCTEASEILLERVFLENQTTAWMTGTPCDFKKCFKYLTKTFLEKF